MERALTKQFNDYLISQDLDPYSMSEEERETYKDSYKQELYPGSATEPGSIVNTLTSNNPTETTKAKIVTDTVADKFIATVPTTVPTTTISATTACPEGDPANCLYSKKSI